MKMIRKAPLAALLVMMLGAGALAAQQPAHQGMGQMGGMMEMGEHMAAMAAIQAYAPAALLEKKADLALTKDQVATLEALASDVKQAKAKAQADHDTHHGQLARLFEQAAPRVAEVKEHARGAMVAMAEGHSEELAAAAKAKAALTAEQRLKVDASVTHAMPSQH